MLFVYKLDSNYVRIIWLIVLFPDNLNMERSFASLGDANGDPVVWSGRLKPFLSYRSRYSMLSSVKENSGSSSSMASVTGSTQNLLDPTKLMTLQDDARCTRHRDSTVVVD